MISIAVAYANYATSESGGARESLLTLLDGLAQHRDIVVEAYQTPPTDDFPETTYPYDVHVRDTVEVPKLTWANQVVERAQWRRYLSDEIGTEHDLLITQNELGPASISVAESKGIPSLLFIRSMALTGYEKYDPNRGSVANLIKTDLGGRVQYPFLKKNFDQYRSAANAATHTIANSEFTTDKIRNLFNCESQVIYPPIKLENYLVDYNPEGYTTMVNPRAEYKGADIFLDIAESMQQEQFLLVGPIASTQIEHRANDMGNVTHWSWCDDMREAYRESKAVVVPSRVEEAFGRVPAEAMVSGIPCVVSDRGGLLEVVGDTGEVVSQIDSTRHWVEAIDSALERHDPEAQKRRVQRFSAVSQSEKLCRIVNELIPLM